MIDWTKEWTLIVKTSIAYGVDPYFIAAIRHTENGGDGKEFGVLSKAAPTYQQQLNDCCATVRNKIIAYKTEPFDFISKQGLILTIAYAADFVKYFASKWAPSDVENDPNHLNANWYPNCLKTYNQMKYSDRLPTIKPTTT